MVLSRSAGVLAALALVLAPSALAVPPSQWTTIPLPANLSSGPNSIGTTTTFQTSTAIHFYSGVTKQWAVLPVTAPGPLFQANDYAIVQDSGQIHGFSATTGKVESVAVSPSAVVVSGPASSSWVTLVADGLQAWGFSAFKGVWVPLTLSQPNPVMVSSRLMGLIRDGSTVYGFNAPHGDFVPVAADPQAVLSVVGEAEVGTAHSPTVFRAFSTQQDVWATANVASTANKVNQNEVALVFNGLTATGFSGLTGTLATYTATTGIASIGSAEGVCGFKDGNDVVLFGSGSGTFVKMSAPGASIAYDYHLAMVQDASSVTPYSALTGGFGPTLVGAFTISTNDCIGFADGAVSDYAYSPILNAWALAPATSIVGGPVLVRSSAVIPIAGGYWAFSARHGDWVQQGTTLNATFVAPNSGSTFVALDNATDIAHVFDARLDRWATVVGTGPLTVSVSRHTAMAFDTQFGYGFGQPSGEWESVPLASASVQMDVASSIGTIKDGNDLHVYSVQGSLSYTSRFPEFTRATNLGNTLVLYQVAPANSALLMMLGLEPAHIDLGLLLGTLNIDPSLLLTFPLPQAVPANGLLEIALPIPVDPVLVGVEPQIQNFVMPPVGPPWLSTSVAPVLF